jgi:hypothetical protein
MLLTACGCTISITPWTKVAPPPPPPGAPGLDGYPPGAMGPNFQGPSPRPLPPGQQNVGGPVPANNEMYVQMLKQFNDMDAEKKALAEKVQQLNMQILSGQNSLRQATHEMEASTDTVKRTREEMRQWENEMNEMRKRIRSLEDFRKGINRDLEEINHLLQERNREPLRSSYLERMQK